MTSCSLEYQLVGPIKMEWNYANNNFFFKTTVAHNIKTVQMKKKKKRITHKLARRINGPNGVECTVIKNKNKKNRRENPTVTTNPIAKGYGMRGRTWRFFPARVGGVKVGPDLKSPVGRCDSIEPTPGKGSGNF